MATIQITLPDALAETAAKAGLFDPKAAEAMIREKLRAQAGAELREIWRKLDADPLPPMTDEELQAEIDAARADMRRASGN